MTEREKWDAVVNSDVSYDGRFCYGVKTTGIYCRPSCASKRPRRENAVFFDTPEQASAAGFRPCKRCRPDITGYAPMSTVCEQAKRIIDGQHSDAKAMRDKLKSLGVNDTHLARMFFKQYGMTPHGYMRTLRINDAQALISGGASITEAAFECGYGSIPAFYRDFKLRTGMTPKQFSKAGIR